LYTHIGQCTCGSVSIEFSSPKDITAYSPRKCDCQYCMKRGIEYLSDPLGQITFESYFPLLEEKQGSEQATFLLCHSCQSVVAVCYVDKNFSLGSLNATLLNEVDKLRKSVVVSPKGLDKNEKITRWRQLWSEMLLEEVL